MSKGRSKAQNKPSGTQYCAEKCSCETDKAPAVFLCSECGTYQCEACEEDLHREGEYFFHERAPLDLMTQHQSADSKLPQKSRPAKSAVSQCNPSKRAKSTCDSVNTTVSYQGSSTTDRHPTKHQNKGDVAAEVDNHPKPLTSVLDNISLPELEVPEFDETDISSGEFHSLGLDSILSSNLNSFDMKGPKKSKSKKPGHQSLKESSASEPIISLDVDPHSDYFSAQAPSKVDLADTEYPDSQGRALNGPPSLQSDGAGDEDIISDLMQSMTETQLNAQLGNGLGNGVQCAVSPAHEPRESHKPHHSNKTAHRSGSLSTAQSFLLIDETESIQVKDKAELVQRLGCAADAKVKVVSIFGNTGDGKSYTLNQTFFKGDEVFATSADQETCTVGVWAAYDPDKQVVCVDTEGLLGVTSNQNKRTRLLLKVLAVSDVIIYRSCADRLHTDLFQFLGDASQAYSKHFKIELEGVMRGSGHRFQDLGPSVVVFHETSRTNTLDNSGSGRRADEILRERFAKLEYDISSFSAVHYVGVKTSRPPTDFTPLSDKLRQSIEDCSVRSPRSPGVVLTMLQVLNSKFKGDIYSHSPNSFPEEFFTCASKCLACHNRCKLSMNHKKDHHHGSECRYVHVYDNKVYVCKACYQKGRKNVVVPKTCASDDNSFMGVAKYAWSGYVLECRDCGIIYQSRKHWYGNRDPTEIEVQIEIRHIWPGQAAMLTGTHNAARKLLDGVKVVADTVGTYSSKPAKILSDWVADQVAPPYWKPNVEVKECHSCHRYFNDQEKKHHCRACGEGFCDECTQYTKPVPERGWGPSPVRVCEPCYNQTGRTASNGLVGGNDGNSLIPRQVVENVQSVLGAVASVAIDYPMEVIKDSARPAYWIPDHLIKACHLCNEEFGPKLTIHHCRACGNGVCHPCSAKKRQVPSRGWDRIVRVCNTCYDKEGAL